MRRIVQCMNCGKQHAVEGAKAGDTIKCLQCEHVVKVNDLIVNL